MPFMNVTFFFFHCSALSRGTGRDNFRISHLKKLTLKFRIPKIRHQLYKMKTLPLVKTWLKIKNSVKHVFQLQPTYAVIIKTAYFIGALVEDSQTPRAANSRVAFFLQTACGC